MSKARQSVCIVGAGPAGLVCALALAQKGIVARVFEKSASHGLRSRATGLKAETLAVLDRLGVGQTIRKMATPVYGTYQSFNGAPLRYIPFADPDARSCDNLSLNQSDTEAVLIQALESKTGVRVEWNKAARLEGSRLVSQDGASEVPDIIIAADGRFSTLRDAAGIAVEKTQDSEISFGCDASVAGEKPLDHRNMHQMFYPQGRVVFVPLPGENRFKISGTFSREILRHPMPDSAVIQKLVSIRTGISIDRVEDVFLYRLGSVRAQNLVKGNVVLAGDAAQTFYPNGGFGLNTAIGQAAHLAEVLAKNGDIKTYETHWQSAVNRMFTEMNRLRGATPK